MILLDTDHVTILVRPGSERHTHLTRRMAASHDQRFATTIVNAEEQIRGWLAEINRHPAPLRQLSAYENLSTLLAFLPSLPLIALDERAADEFERLRKAKVRIGSMDLKIACIALTQDALLLSANLRDFQQVPGLRVEDWLME